MGRLLSSPLILLMLLSGSAFADHILPYSTRTKAYSGYSTTVQGDNETIGMANATVAIPGSISSLETNPAGLTMTMGSVSAQINSNEMRDRTITGVDHKIKSNQWGLAVVPGDWGFALTSYTPSFEGGTYESPNTSQNDEYEISLKQVRFSAARSLLKKKLSLGASFEIDRATRKIGSEERNASDLSFKLGAIYHIKDHLLVGASYSPPQDIGDSLARSGGSTLPGFAQPIRTPMLLTVGTGWIPNRFFSVGFSIAAVGTTANTALLRDESRIVGEHFTLQPRLGASYVIAQYDHVKVSTAVGTYYETPRIDGVPRQLHGTFAFQVNPWFMNVGLGVDRADRYNNLIFSIGVDIVRAARTLKMIPRDTVPAKNGFWPEPLKIEADGLPDTLTSGEAKKFASPSVGDVSTIISEIPENIEKTLMGQPTASELREQKAKDADAKKSRKRKPKSP